jgi:phosphoglycolate phosphatase-like HAD superfamily hydrolase
MKVNNLIINPKKLIHNAKNIFFDLDETLVYTNDANNEAYNYSAKLLGLRLPQKERITKVDLPFSKLNNLELIRLKNEHYTKFLHLTKINSYYYELMIQYLNFSNCFIISAGQYDRVNSIIKYHKLEVFFKEIFTEVNDKYKFISDNFKQISVLFDSDIQ